MFQVLFLISFSVVYVFEIILFDVIKEKMILLEAKSLTNMNHLNLDMIKNYIFKLSQ